MHRSEFDFDVISGPATPPPRPAPAPAQPAPQAPTVALDRTTLDRGTSRTESSER